MVQFLKKYWLNIILGLLVIVLAFWYNPRQQDLYLRDDFESIEKKSTKALLWTMAIGTIIIFAIAMKGVKKIGEVGNVVFCIALLSIPFYFCFKLIFLSGFLALNRIELSDHFEKKYTITYSLVTDKQTPLIHDFRTGKTLFYDNIGRLEKLNNLNTGDTVVISFRKGLLGVPFNPIIK